MLGGVLKYNVAMDDELVAEARRRWQDRYGGVQNWGDVAASIRGRFQAAYPQLQGELDFKPSTAAARSACLARSACRVC